MPSHCRFYFQGKQIRRKNRCQPVSAGKEIKVSFYKSISVDDFWDQLDPVQVGSLFQISYSPARSHFPGCNKLVGLQSSSGVI